LLALIALAVYRAAAAAEPTTTPPVPNDSKVTREFDRGAPPPGDVGAGVYKNVCAACHDGGVDRAPHPATLSLMTPESVYRVLTEGVMKTQAAALSDEQKLRVAEFITRRKIGSAAPATAPAPRCSGKAAQFDFAEPPVWPNWGFSYGNERAIPADVARIDRSNIGRLKLEWAFAFPNAVRARSSPMLAGGAIYVGSHDGTVYALDRNTACVRWAFAAPAEVRTGIVISSWRAGDKSARPRAYFGDILGSIYAVDAITGKLIWRDRADPHPSTMITGTPTLYEGKLYVPVSSLEVIAAAEAKYSCCTFRGSVVAYDAMTGKREWQAFSVGEVPTKQSKNSVGTDLYGPSGAPIWNSPAIDARRGQLYVGTGENYSSPATTTSDGVLAIDLHTGKVRWAYQGTAHDAWNASCVRDVQYNCPKENGPDFDVGAAPVLARASNGRDYVLAGQKSGMVHAIDPDTGDRVWQTKVGRGGITGGVHFGLAVYGDTVFVPIDDKPDGRTYAEPARPGLYALDLRNGQYLWKSPSENVCNGRPLCYPGIGNALTVTSDLVFAGGNDGYLRVHDIRNGAVLWSFDTARAFDTVSGAKAQGGSMGGAAAAVLYKERLFVNSGYGFSGKMPGNVLLMFEVDEHP
jgi:polyvinyl alcohol dehydrogenase (cytochrome)